MGKVLFLDDRPSDIQPLMEILAEDDVPVLKAVTAEEGWEKLRSANEQGEPVTLLVLDIMFPAMPLHKLLQLGAEAVRQAPADDLWQGARLYKKIREEFPDLKIIVYSVRSEQEIKTAFLDTNFDCIFLRKGSENPINVYRTIKANL